MIPDAPTGAVPLAPAQSNELDAVVGPLRGRVLRKVEHAGAWRLRFTGGIHLSSRSAWRLLVGGRVTVSSEDDGLPLGLREAVDAGSELASALEGRTVVAAGVSAATGDLTLDFGDALELQLLQLSAIRDAWTLDVPNGLAPAPAVCLGGGQVARVHPPEEG